MAEPYLGIVLQGYDIRWQLRRPVDVMLYLRKMMGAFPFDEKFWFEVPKISNDQGNGISGISGKEDNLARYTKIFGNFLSGIAALFVFPLGSFGVFS